MIFFPLNYEGVYILEVYICYRSKTLEILIFNKYGTYVMFLNIKSFLIQNHNFCAIYKTNILIVTIFFLSGRRKKDSISNGKKRGREEKRCKQNSNNEGIN